MINGSSEENGFIGVKRISKNLFFMCLESKKNALKVENIF
jgi:hypothetical protein